MNIDWNSLRAIVQDRVATVGLQILGALVIYIVGRWLIGMVVNAVQRVLVRQKIEPTIGRFIGNTINVALNIVLVVAILGRLGVETTSFAALIAAMGLAIGMAWAGLLGNFAAGAFLLVLRPFKVGDFVTVGGITGTVHEIGLFVTTLDMPDNVRTFVGNTKVFSDTIQNYTANPYRRVELTAQISGGADPHLAISMLKERVAKIANVCADPAPVVTIATFTPFGPVLAVRPFCHNDHYWQVYFDTNMVIRETLGDGAFPGPAYPLAVADAKAAVAAR
jgi:small conductance mechanosensitive channel